MTNLKTWNWFGESGTPYSYTIYPIGTKFNAMPGNYIFVRMVGAANVEAIYVGQTESFEERFANHHKELCILAAGATHVHVRVNRNEIARRNEETDLIRALKPVCNG